MAGLPLGLAAQSMTQNEIRNLLQESLNYTKNATFAATDITVNTIDVPGLTIWGHNGVLRYNSDSTSKSYPRHRRKIIQGAGTEEFIWEEYPKGKIFNHNAMISKNLSNDNLLSLTNAFSDEARLAAGRYAIKAVTYHQIECYQIIARYPADDATISTANTWNFARFDVPHELCFGEVPPWMGRSLTPEEYRSAAKVFRNAYFRVLEFVISADRQKPFLYNVTGYNSKGQKTAILSFGKVEFPESVDASLFSAPSGVSIYHADNDAEHSKMYFQAFGPGWQDVDTLFSTKVGRWWNSFCANIGSGIQTVIYSSWFSWILFAIGVGLLGVVLYAKKRNR